MYIKGDKVRINRIVLDLHDVIADSSRVVLFEYVIRPRTFSNTYRILNIVTLCVQ